VDNIRGSPEARIAALEAENEALRKDLAAREAVERDLRASLDRFRDFAESASEWRWEMGPDLCFTRVTKQYEHATGIRAESIIGKRRDEVGIFDPRDENMERHLTDLEARRPFRNFEYSQIGENGAPMHFAVSGRPVFDADGRFQGYRGVARDITTRKNAERELREARDQSRAVMDALPFEFALKDTEGRYLQVNRAWEGAFGCAGDEAVGRRPQEIIPGEFSEIFAECDRRVLEEGRILETEEQAPRPDGSIRDFLAIRFPLSDAGGKVRGLGLIAMDVTERKAVEKALEDREEQLRTITDNLPVLIARFDRDERYSFANRTAERWYGRPVSSIVGKSIPEIFGAGAYEKVKPHIETVLSGEPAHFEGSFDYPDGATRDIEITFVPDRAAGEVQGWLALAQDITERKRAERALRGSEGQLRTVIDNLPALVVRFDRQRRIAAVNRTAEKWYARPAAEIVGKTVAEMLGEEIGELFEPHLGWALLGQDVSFQVNIPYPDGVCRDIEATYVPDRAPDRTVQGVFALIQDGTARKAAERALRESEARLRAIVENSPAAIYLKDFDGRFLVSSREHLKWCGLPPEKVIGQTAHDVFPANFAEEYAEHDRNVVESGQVHSRESLVALRDGTVRNIVANKFPVYDDDGKMIAVGGIDLDITPLKKLETELLRKERLAAMGQLTGTVAHELRNPLGAIAASVGVLRMKCVQAGIDAERALARAERGVQRCERIVTELLDFARAKGLQRRTAVLDDCLSGILEELDIPPGIESAFSSGCPEMTVRVDREELLRAIVNVVDNACHAMSAAVGGNGAGDRPAARLVIETRCRGGRACITVSDTGQGMTPDVLAQVVEPLFSTKSFGTGLGLPTVKRIMEDHGGGLEIESEVGKGTRVELWLPVDRGTGQGGDEG